jgi:hypothetical protein
MGLPWVRLDTQFASNHKILYLIEDRKWRAAFVWLASLAHAGAQGTDGFVPAAALPLLHGTKAEAKALVDVGLWQETPGGWQINSWTEHQPTSEEMQMRRKRAQNAAMARWHGPAP